MGKIEEGGASVGSMLPVTPVDEVLSKTLTTESVDAEYAALQLSDKPEMEWQSHIMKACRYFEKQFL